MTLADWLKQNRIRRSHFAARIGVSPTAITDFCRGQRYPSRESAEAIYRATNGEVTPTDFLLEQMDAA